MSWSLYDYSTGYYQSALTRTQVTKIGYYNPFLFLGAALIATGSGLYSTLNPDTRRSTYIGFQILFGAGTGTVMQMV